MHMWTLPTLGRNLYLFAEDVSVSVRPISGRHVPLSEVISLSRSTITNCIKVSEIHMHVVVSTA